MEVQGTKGRFIVKQREVLLKLETSWSLNEFFIYCREYHFQDYKVNDGLLIPTKNNKKWNFSYLMFAYNIVPFLM